MTRYRTIVADPPWFFPGATGIRTKGAGRWDSTGKGVAGTASVLPYRTMSTDEIAALPVPDLAEKDAHLYLWTFGRHIPAAYEIVAAWGFAPSALLTWCKAPMGLGLGGAFAPTAEHILFARRGRDIRIGRQPSTWWQLKRPQLPGGGPAHSAKPEAFLDLVEQVSPGPYLEMFARRNRLGWDTWGNECLQHVELDGAA